MISLDMHDMNFPQWVINDRKDFRVYEQGGDDSPPPVRRNTWGFLTAGSTSGVSLVGDNWVMHKRIGKRQHFSVLHIQSCYRKEEEMRSMGLGANSAGRWSSAPLPCFPLLLAAWRSMLQLTETTCSSLEAITARAQRKLILMEWLEKYPRKGKVAPNHQENVAESFFFPQEIYSIWTTETCSSRKTQQTAVVMTIRRNQQHHLFFPYDGIRGRGGGKTLAFPAFSRLLNTPKLQLIPSVLYLSHFNSNVSSFSLQAWLKLPPDQSNHLLQPLHN